MTPVPQDSTVNVVYWALSGLLTQHFVWTTVAPGLSVTSHCTFRLTRVCFSPELHQFSTLASIAVRFKASARSDGKKICQKSSDKQLRSCDSSAPSQQSNKAPAVSQPGGRERPGISHFVCMAARRLINSTVFKGLVFFFVFCFFLQKLIAILI